LDWREVGVKALVALEFFIFRAGSRERGQRA